MDNIMDGRRVSEYLRKQIKDKIESNKISANLCVIQIGDDSASNLYIRNKKRACAEVGIGFKHIRFSEDTDSKEVLNEIRKLNNDSDVTGILVQLPLPRSFNEEVVINAIDPVKDVDGLSFKNVGKLSFESKCLIPCTPLGIMELLKAYDVKIEGKNVCIVGRSNLVGKPMFQLMLQNNATVTVCHSKTINLNDYTKRADILIVAAGYPNLITKDMVKEGAIVIDVGINKTEDKLCGDVDFDSVSKKAALITPVPGGVGPMTVSCLLKNVVKAYELQNEYCDDKC